MDPMTGRSRGFAFIVFKGLDGLEGALQKAAHIVKGKKVMCKKAEAKTGRIHLGLTEDICISDFDIREGEGLSDDRAVLNIKRPEIQSIPDICKSLVKMSK